jgi:hypothetical protein
VNRWAFLGAAVAVAGVVLALAGRLPEGRADGPATEAETPVTEVSVRVGPGGAEPSLVTVPGGAQVRWTIVNATPRPLAARLPGYEDRFAVPPIAPGAQWTGTFAADRPGDDFALWIDDAPAVRFVVAGSHLVEGHR